MITRPDIPLIKWGISIFLFLLCVEIMAVVFSRKFVAQVRLDHLEARHKMSEARSRLDRAAQDVQDRKTYAAEYDELLRRNIIGIDRRLNWAQELEEIRRRNLVMDFTYTISPRQPYSPASPLESGNYDLHQNRMSISFDLLHEQQLFAFLAALHSGSSGRLILDHCSIERRRDAPIDAIDSFPRESTEGSAIHPNPANLHAECTGGWLTMKKRSAS